MTRSSRPSWGCADPARSCIIRRHMKIDENVSLANYSTMGLGGHAAYVTEVTTADEVAEALKWAKDKNLPSLMIGGGSNVVWRDEGFPGLLLVDKIPGYETSAGDDG